MLRRKWMVPYPGPDYRRVDYWYTLRLHHGGVVVHDVDCVRWIEGTISSFDFVDTRKLSLRYLEGLAEQLGYMEGKTFYELVEGSGLKKVECEYDIWMNIQTAKGKEFTLFFNPQSFIGRPSPIVEPNKEEGVMKVFSKGGKKYVTLSSLETSVENGERDKGKKQKN